MMNKKEHAQFKRWQGIMGRCYKPNHNKYKYYGAKGVTVHERWHDFWNFVEDVEKHLLNGHLLYQAGWELDKDSKGGNIYSLENCMVITSEENQRLAREKQQKKIVAYTNSASSKYDSVSEASRQLNIKRPTLLHYLKTGKQHSSGQYFKYFL